MYRNHAQLHHLAFTDGNMVIGPTRDLGLIMMPWYTMIGLFVVASPVMVVAGRAARAGPGGRVPAGRGRATSSFYETLHALYHLPDATLDRAGLGRLRVVPAAAGPPPPPSHPGSDGGVNFNVTVPLMDRLFGTLEK